MPGISFLETAYSQSRSKWRDEFYALQAKRGGGCDPFADSLAPEIRGAFEFLPRSLVPEALSNVRLRLPHGSCVVRLVRPTIDEQRAGWTDTLASQSPEWWVGAMQAAGIPVTNYAVNMAESTLVINW